LKRLVGKYSEFINFPIKLWNSREEEKEVPMNEEELAEQLKIEQEDAAAESDDDENEEEEEGLIRVLLLL
jgi:heat shock protein beta